MASIQPHPAEPIRTRRSTRTEFSKSYDTYVEEVETQHAILESNIHSVVWRYAMASLPYIKSITICAGHQFKPEAGHAKNPYRVHCVNDGFEVSYHLGCNELMYLLQIAYKGSLNLKSLKVGVISWQFFDDEYHDGHNLSQIAQSLGQLKTLKIFMTTDVNESDETGPESWRCSLSMAKGGLRRFLKAIPTLQNLMVEFDFSDDEENHGATFADIVDDNSQWPQLKSIGLSCIEIEASNFLAFAKRHKSTLKELEMRDIYLNTTWLPFLRQLKELLKLDRASFQGELSGIFDDHAQGGWFCEEWYLFDTDLNDPLRDGLNGWLTQAGTGELSLNHENLREQLSVF